MNKRLKYNLSTLVIYFIIFYIMLLPLSLFDLRYLLVNISYSFVLSFISGILNLIYIELRRLNGEKFEQFDEDDQEDEEDEGLLKS